MTGPRRGWVAGILAEDRRQARRQGVARCRESYFDSVDQAQRAGFSEREAPFAVAAAAAARAAGGRHELAHGRLTVDRLRDYLRATYPRLYERDM